MARLITLSTPESGVTDGMELSFRAPCDCTSVTGISLDGVEYAIVDTSGEALTSCSNYFAKNSILTVIIDTVNKKATLLNPRVNTYTKSLGSPEDEASASGSTVWAKLKHLISEMSGKAPKSHTHTKSEISDFAHNHDDRYYTEDEIDSKMGEKSNSNHTHTEIADHETRVKAIETWKTDVGNGSVSVEKAKEAATLTLSTKAKIPSSNIISCNLTHGRSYIITVPNKNTPSYLETMVFFNMIYGGGANNVCYSTKSAHDYYCKYEYNSGNLMVFDTSGTALTLPIVYIREL